MNEHIQFFQPDFTKLGFSTRTVDSLIYEFNCKEGRLDFDVWLPSVERNLQRPLVWEQHGLTNHGDRYYHHRKLIESILSYVDIGKFVVYKLWTNVQPYLTIKVIDGKQRFHAISDFYNNKFGVIRNGIEYKIEDMPTNIVRRISNSPIAWAEIDSQVKELSDKELITLFDNINFAGVPQ
jgi:hypothetical protein